MLEVLFLFLLFFCFFVLFSLSKRDFVLMRKNISPAEIFDVGAISIIIAFFFGRVFYIINFLKLSFFFPLSFFHIYKYQGFSFFGFFIGGVISLFFLFKRTKALSRVYDIFSLSFFPLLIVPFVFFKYTFFPISILLFFLIIIPILFSLFLYSHNKYIMKDGTISIITLLLISLHSFMIEFISNAEKFFIFSFLQWISLILFLILTVLLIINQKILLKK